MGKKICLGVFYLALVLNGLLLDSSSFGAEVKGGGKGLIVFSSNRSGPWRIWIMQADGSEQRPLTKGDPDANDVDPCFRPDGSSILFSSTRGGKIGIWRMAVDGSGLERICDGDQAEWSPDSQKIVFRREGAIRIRDLSSQQEKIIVPKDWTDCSGGAWSPDGQYIAFARLRDDRNELFYLPAAGSDPVKIYDQKGACEPHWSPDGIVLVYETETHICTIQPDGKKNRLITYYGGIQRYGRYSPDGKYLVYCQGMSEQGPWELYLIPATGGTPVPLTEGGSDMNPDWK